MEQPAQSSIELQNQPADALVNPSGPGAGSPSVPANQPSQALNNSNVSGGQQNAGGEPLNIGG